MRIPKMQHFKPKNLARVRIAGADGKPKVIYLGPWGSDEAQQRYDEIIAQYLTSNRNADSVNITMNRICILFLQHCDTYYVKNGEPTSEVSVIRIALREVVAACGRLPVSQFSPLKLKAIRERMIAHGWKRKSINQQVRRIVRMLKWGVSHELVPFDVYSKCTTVQGLAKGRSDAVESNPVKPVPVADIVIVKRSVRPVVWDMIRLQYRTGMRPGEVRSLTVADLNLRGDVWEYRPSSHKTEHHERERRVFIGPKAQRILAQYLTADRERYVFESSPGNCYTKDTYNRAISRACRRAGNSGHWPSGSLRLMASAAPQPRSNSITIRSGPASKRRTRQPLRCPRHSSKSLHRSQRRAGDRIKTKATLDRTQRETVRADIQRTVRRLLTKHGYPPDAQEAATQVVIRQAELLADGLVS